MRELETDLERSPVGVDALGTVSKVGISESVFSTSMLSSWWCAVGVEGEGEGGSVGICSGVGG